MSSSITVPASCNGPLDSGNGGYSAGMLAAFVDGIAEVSLRSPVPLDRQIVVERDDDGSARAIDGEALIADATPVAALELDVPEPVSIAEAREASARYRGTQDGPFSRCFVCGRAREDAWGVFAGAVGGRDVVASPWTPPESAADDAGDVRPEFVWAVLDCPTYFALYPDSHPMSFLAQITARIDAPVRAGTEHVVIAWPIGRDGRKHLAGSAVLSAEGETLAAARALLIEARPAG
jgi:hypothetical protein